MVRRQRTRTQSPAAQLTTISREIERLTLDRNTIDQQIEQYRTQQFMLVEQQLREVRAPRTTMAVTPRARRRRGRPAIGRRVGRPPAVTVPPLRAAS